MATRQIHKPHKKVIDSFPLDKHFSVPQPFTQTTPKTSGQTLVQMRFLYRKRDLCSRKLATTLTRPTF
ncbi:hypothetical protein EMIT048CA2_110201 [Pseudomonas chlororaphis]